MKSTHTLLIAAAAACVTTGVLAFQVLPKVSDVDRKLGRLGSNTWLDAAGQFFVSSAIPMLKSPVHETITLAAIDCAQPTGNEVSCLTPDAVQANRVFLYGVRWPDDPPFRLAPSSPPRISGCDVGVTVRSTSQPKCWMGLFTDAGKQAERALEKDPSTPAFGPGDYILYRSHYGDLQFMHSMGTRDGETSAITVGRMKMWAKFMWAVATREVPADKYIRTLGHEGLADYFPGDITATNLLATGIVEVRKDLDKVALGVLLHMVQDSFSQAHTERGLETGGTCEGLAQAKPGRIQRFYSYAHQDSSLHDHEDTLSAMELHVTQISPNAVDVTRAFYDLWARKANWTDAEKLFDCVFDVEMADEAATPGRFAKAPRN